MRGSEQPVCSTIHTTRPGVATHHSPTTRRRLPRRTLLWLSYCNAHQPPARAAVVAQMGCIRCRKQPACTNMYTVSAVCVGMKGVVVNNFGIVFRTTPSQSTRRLESIITVDCVHSMRLRKVQRRAYVPEHICCPSSDKRARSAALAVNRRNPATQYS